MIMLQNFYELVWIFIIYAFIGWCTEVSYAALDTGKFVNRGFLNGPYCPIYGCGVVIVVAILTPLKENLLILFAGSFLLTSVLEYITGYILEKVFHNKWWDYSDKPFNIKGYVCLKFSIYWGLACTFIMDIIHPIIYAAIRFIPFVLGVVLLSIIMCVFAADCIITVTTILKFNKRLKVMDEMAASIHRLSDEIGENIYENVTDVIEKSEKFQETHVELMDKISETKENIYGLPQTAKDKLAETTGAAKDKLAETTGAAKDKFAETTGAAKDKLAETTGAAKDKLSETKESISELPQTAKNKLAEKAENYAASREEKKRAAELARDIIYGKPFYAVNSEIGYFASSREKAEQFAEAAELFYRDIFVSHYDREGRLLINAEQRDIIRGCAGDFTAEQMTSAASCAETAQRDLSYHVSPAHALKYMAFDIQKKIKE